MAETLITLLHEGQYTRFLFLWKVIETFAPEFFEYVMEAEEWEEIAVEEEEKYLDFSRMDQFESRYESQKKPFRDWHHIVEKDAEIAPGSMGNRKSLHSTENVVQIPRAKHWEITKFYSEPNKASPFNGLSPREWLRGQPYAIHKEWGLRILRMFGVLK